MRPVHCLVPVVALLLAAAAPAQKERVFHIPAGDHRLGELLAQCEQALKAPIARDQIVGIDERRPVHLQHDLALPADAWEDVLASLLFAHDLVLTRGGDRQRHEVLPMPARRTRSEWIAQRAESLPLAEFLTRPTRQGPVQVKLATALPAPMATTLLRPVGMGLPGGLVAEATGAELAITGLAGSVRAALATLASNDPGLAAQVAHSQPRAWPRTPATTQHTLPAGTHRLAAIVDALAKATGTNIVLTEAHDLEISLTAPVVGDALAFEDELTTLLWEQRIGVLALAPVHGLSLARAVSPVAPATPNLALPLAVDEVFARPRLQAYAEVTWQAKHVGMDKLMTAVRQAVRVAAAAAGGSGLEFSTTGNGLLLRGFTSDLRPILQQLRDTDRQQ
jgi:hypothetical protein